MKTEINKNYDPKKHGHSIKCHNRKNKDNLEKLKGINQKKWQMSEVVTFI